MSARVLAVLAVLLTGIPASAQTSCPSPDALCTGDPCVTAATVIEVPCVLDFGTCALVVAEGFAIRNGAAVTLRAGTITVQAGINGRDAVGAAVTLVAAGDVSQQGLIDVSGTTTAGTIAIQAGGDVTLAGKMKATGARPTTSGGTIAVDAGGRVFGPVTISDDVHGGLAAHAGSAVYHGVAGVDLIGHLIMRSGSGGYAEFVSTGGPVSIGTDIRTRVTVGAGATLVLRAATDATVARGMSADGRTDGGSILVAGATVTMPRHQGLHARGRGGAGGSVTVVGGSVFAHETLMADGTTGGGVVDVSGDSLIIDAGVSAQGRTGGGHVSLVATAGDLLMQPTVSAAGGGGTIEARATGALTARGTLRAAPGGCIALAAGGVLDTSGAVPDGPLSASCP